MINGVRMVDETQTVEESSEVEKEYVVTSLETLKVMADPVRLHILESLVGHPMTVKELAKRLGTPAAKLYYHINLMEEHGLIKVVSQRIVSGILEKQYRTRAKSFDIDKGLLALGGSQDGGPLDMMLKVVFDATREDVRKAITLGLMKPTEEDPALRNGMLMRVVTRFSQDRLKEFQDRLLSLIKEFDSKENTEKKLEEGHEDEDQITYGFTVALFPFSSELPNSTTIID